MRRTRRVSKDRRRWHTRTSPEAEAAPSVMEVLIPSMADGHAQQLATRRKDGEIQDQA